MAVVVAAVVVVVAVDLLAFVVAVACFVVGRVVVGCRQTGAS